MHFLCRGVGTIGWLATFALMTLGCSTPMHAGSLLPGKTVAPGRLFEPLPAALAFVAASELPYSSTDSVAQANAEAYGGEPAITAVSIEGLGLDLLLDWNEDGSKNGAEGLRRFILIAVLLGAAVRFLTSATFYEWAADVFGPLAWADTKE